MTREQKKFAESVGVRLPVGDWEFIAALAKKRGTSRGQEIRLLVGEALAARRESADVSMLEKKVDRILAWVLREEEAQIASLELIRERLKSEIKWGEEGPKDA